MLEGSSGHSAQFILVVVLTYVHKFFDISLFKKWSLAQLLVQCRLDLVT